MKTLTDREEELMKLFWDKGPMYVREMLELMPEPKPHFNTISTFVRLLEQKGFVGHERTGSSFRYHAIISEEEYKRNTLKGVISRYFNNSVKGLLSALVADEKLTDSELKELIEIARSARNEKGGEV